MDRETFSKKFPTFSSRISVTFGDSSAHDDEKLAREMDIEASPTNRIIIISETLLEAHKFMSLLDTSWEALSDEANRNFDSPNNARRWLVRIMTAWQEELKRLQDRPDRLDQ